MNEDNDDEIKANFSDVFWMIVTDNRIYKITFYFLLIVITLSLMLASYNMGYGKGYNYVLGFKEEYINKYCTCLNTSIDKIQQPIDKWDKKMWASLNIEEYVRVENQSS